MCGWWRCLVVFAVLACVAGTAAGGVALASSAVVGSDAVVSTNWGGYAAVGGPGGAAVTFTSVGASWRQPAAQCAGGGNAAAAVWVGLGGYAPGAQAVEQIGTDADCGSSGVPSYFAWYELVPGPRVVLGLPIRPGDALAASVSVHGAVVVLQLVNRSLNAVVRERVVASGLDLGSAEWIAEAPSSCLPSSCTALSLANFGAVSFTRVAAVGNGTAGTLTSPGWTTVPLRLATAAAGAGTSAPTPPSLDGRSFGISWLPAATG